MIGRGSHVRLACVDNSSAVAHRLDAQRFESSVERRATRRTEHRDEQCYRLRGKRVGVSFELVVGEQHREIAHALKRADAAGVGRERAVP
jgi:hypothetical protein